MTARFTGDEFSNPTYYRMNVLSRVNASTTLTRHYKTAKIGSTAYQYFRKSKDPLITHTMTPYPGRKARAIIQVWQGGKWQLWSGRDTKLSTSGKASFTFVTGAKVGKRFWVCTVWQGSCALWRGHSPPSSSPVSPAPSAKPNPRGQLPRAAEMNAPHEGLKPPQVGAGR